MLRDFKVILKFILVYSRDRRRIQKKMAERARAKAAGEDIEEKQSESTANGVTNSCPVGPVVISGPSVTIPHYPMKDGIDNMTFKHSHVDIKATTENEKRRNSNKIRTTAEIEFANSSSVPNRTLSQDLRVNLGERFAHLPPDCLAVKKTMRRHSYEVAVAEHSWLPVDPPDFASSETIINTYRYGSNLKTKSKSTTIGFENRAYDSEDYKSKTRMHKQRLHWVMKSKYRN